MEIAAEDLITIKDDGEYIYVTQEELYELNDEETNKNLFWEAEWVRRS